MFKQSDTEYRNEIIEMAKEAGFFVWTDDQKTIEGCGEDLERFAKLVDAKATAKEREACAKLCEEEGKLWSKAGCTDTQTFGLCATVIRARGEA